MKSLMLLTIDILIEDGISVNVCTTRDLKTIRSRFEKEGLSFLTITLPSFCSSFENCLEKKQVSHNDFPGFRFNRGLPAFLQGFLELVFDRSTGAILHTPDVRSIRAIRQICRLHSKIELPTTEARSRKALRKYVQTDKDLGKLERGLCNYAALGQISAVLFGKILSPLENNLFEGDYRMFMPKHGPGSTADRLVGNQKFSASQWTRRLDVVLPFGEFLLPNYRDTTFIERIQILEPGQEQPVRVILVPKTMKTPRVIAMEPTNMQFAQQSVLRYLSDAIEEDPLLRGFIGLRSQVPNQNLAKEGSITGSLATLDLSEASDRVSMDLVRAVFTRFPHFLEVIEACRSTQASVSIDGNEEIISLNKFASMGSALCFPIETMVFMAIIFYSIWEEEGFRTRPSSLIHRMKGKVRAFGDDLIVPTGFVDNIIWNLSTVGLEVNATKSFWNGNFRESCGSDWYSGHDVSVVKTRKPFPRDIRNVDEVLSFVSLRNQLYMLGYWETCRKLDSKIVSILRYFPIAEDTSPVLSRRSVAFEGMAERIDRDLHLPLVKGWVVSVQSPINEIDGYRALLKYFVSPSDDPNHLKRSGRPSSVRLKKRWSRVA
ncbi:TPA_asm: RNA-directed RNA polymerase [ssRNA phage SRR6255733_6]|uniref:RNA-directed RNA polymerase n=1 Tax=ssRNA phage SRR6255733_6 TaxID=2786502 RepID=A0A8S5L053_9VIRU|nr:RNA-directed RNA polymerase [ssRNA phage SRR6255733_6]DAD50944.1 TPA_asm: RNA-directed RNA polymerase [ssRNA phage SRR6255733_6]